MTDKEKAIVMAYTGVCMLSGDKFQIFHKYVEDIMGRPVMTHELGWLADTIKEKSKDDFLVLCAEQEPCKDAVSRKAVINKIFYSTDNSGDVALGSALRKRIERLPSVTLQEPKTGHWITKIKSDLRGDMWPTNPKCSECGGKPYYSNSIYNYKFCPYCGVKMVEPQEESEEENDR